MGFQAKTFYIDLATARTGQGQLFNVAGRGIIVTNASDNSVLAQLKMLGEFTADPVDMVKGAETGCGSGFIGFYITNAAQAAGWMEITVTDGTNDFYYTRPHANAISSIDSTVNVVDADTHTKLDTLHVDLSKLDTLNLTLKDPNVKRCAINQLGSNFVGCTAVAAQTLILPATNVNGIVLRTIILCSEGQWVGLYTGNVAPAAYNDVTKPCIARGMPHSSPAHWQPIYLPAGNGLYFVSSSVASSDFCHILYDVL